MSRLLLLLALAGPLWAGDAELTQRIEAIRRDMGARRIAVVYRDHQSGHRYDLRPNEMFSAASMIKVAIMVAVESGIESGRWSADTPVRVANRFPRTGGGATRSTELDRDVHAAIGSTLTVGQLLEAMVARSSNLATNVLLEMVGLPEARRAVQAAGLRGLELHSGMGRGARSGGNNCSAAGFEDFLSRVHAGQVISPRASERMLKLLFAQAIGNGIPAGLPPAFKRKAKIAHKTGNIPTVEHDAALIYLPDRAPYVLSIMTDWPGRGDDHPAALVRVTQAVYEELMR